VTKRLMTAVTSAAAVALLVTTWSTPGTAAANIPPGRKLALLVGINDYMNPEVVAERPDVVPWKDGEPWPKLNGCLNDIRDLATALEREWGFKSGDIKILRDGQATRQAVVTAFEQHLIGQAKPGDIVVFAFSGHGMQVADNPQHSGNLRRDERDGLDEVLVTAESRGAADYVHCIRDDLLADLIARVNSESVVVITDSCHSGTVTRAPGQVRGRGYGGDPAWLPTDSVGPGAPGQPASDSPSGFGESGERTAAGYVHMSAASSEEPARETAGPDRGDTNGVFTKALLGALAQARASDQLSYHSVMDTARVLVAEMNPWQHPQLEGDKHRAVFGETQVAPRAFVHARIVSLAEGTVTLDQGYLYGLTPGSRLCAYPPTMTTASPGETKPLCQAVVTSVEPFSCTARIEGDSTTLSETELKQARWWETEHKFSAKQVVVQVEGFGSPPTAGKLADALKAIPFVSLAQPLPTGGESNWDVLIRPVAGKQNDTIRLDLPGERSIGTLDIGSAGFAQGLRNELRGVYIRKAVLALAAASPALPGDRDFQVTIRDRDGLELVTAGDAIVLHRGDIFSVYVNNTTGTGYYVSVLDVKDKGGAIAVWPPPGAPDQDGFVPGSASTIHVASSASIPPVATALPGALFRAKELGSDVLMVVATRQLVDFRLLLQHIGETGSREGFAARGMNTQIGQTFADIAEAVGLTDRLLSSTRDFAYYSEAPDWLVRTAPLTVLPATK